MRNEYSRPREAAALQALPPKGDNAAAADEKWAVARLNSGHESSEDYAAYLASFSAAEISEMAELGILD